MANEEHLAILKKGVKNWNEWRKANPDITPDLSGAGLNDTNLDGADLRHVSLQGANPAVPILSEQYCLMQT